MDDDEDEEGRNKTHKKKMKKDVVVKEPNKILRAASMQLPSLASYFADHGEENGDGFTMSGRVTDDEIMRTARPGQHPAAWLRAAQSAEGADYVSLFDGDKGSINKAAALFQYVGLPPVDNRNALYPVNL